MQQPQRFAPQALPPGHMARFAQPTFSVLFMTRAEMCELRPSADAGPQDFFLRTRTDAVPWRAHLERVPNWTTS